MMKGSKVLVITMVIVLGILVQLVLCVADTKDTPGRAVVDFTKAYFSLDKSMADRICDNKRIVDDVDVVEEYLYSVAQEAGARGFRLSYMKNCLKHVFTETISRDSTTAVVRITCERKRMINPVFTIIGKLFFIGETYEVDETLNIIKEDGKWKVCGRAFSLSV